MRPAPPRVPGPEERRMTAVVERDPTGPRLAVGTELLGEYRGSGCHEPPQLVRRPDGQVIQVPRLLYLVASSLGDDGDLDRVARQVSREFGREVSPENVSFLVEERLRPTGLLEAPA